jgi:uncharacterized protein
VETRLIKNKTDKKTITKKYLICTSYFSKALGLMFSKKKNLIFTFEKEKKISLHMLFVFFPIWAVYLNKNKKVTQIKKLSPFISTTSGKAKFILELIKKPKIKIGDILDW